MRTLTIFLLTIPLAAQAPSARNAKVETRAVTEGLERQFRALAQNGPAWFGWAVASVPGQHQGCDAESWARSPGPVHLEPPDQVHVLVRAEQGAAVKVRLLSPECELDAGGLTLYWFEGVKPADSIAFLATLAAGPGHVVDGALAAIAIHRDPAADQALERLTAPSQPESLRSKAVFWLGATRGRRGYELLKRIVSEDPSDKVRDKAVFALYVSKESEAVDTTIAVAKNDRSAHVRGQAFFWLAQKAGKKAIGAMGEAIDNDPDTEVKRRAVFGLHQMPNGEGIPKLIEVARSNKNAAVRKQAMFWLGQSKDPRALGFFEEILKP
ncbi:MAG: HEAT repeat domain-containing protein [Bryobacteraceae bacterium]|jgi:hypothetical protein